MKKHLAVFSAILMACICFSGVTMMGASANTVEYGVELFPYGSCDAVTAVDETKTTVNGWGGMGVADSTVKRGDTGYSYKLSFETAGSTDNQRGDFNFLNPTTLAGSYTLVTGFINITALGEGSCAHACVQNSFGFNSYYDISGRITYTAVTDGWVPFALAVTDSVNPVAYVNFYIEGTGTLYLDDISVKNMQGYFPTEADSVPWNAEIAWVGASDYRGGRNLTFFENNEAAFSGERGLKINAGEGYSALPTTCYELKGRSMLETGARYKMSFWFKPEHDAAMPNVIFGKGTWYGGGDKLPATDRYLTLDHSAWTEEATSDSGWKKLSAYFTMPELDSTVPLSMVLLSYAGDSDGYFDCFELLKDNDGSVKVTTQNGEAISEAKVGDVVTARLHVISEKTADEGGEKAAVLLAVYDKSGTIKLVDFLANEKTVNKNVQKIGKSYGLPGDGGGENNGYAYNSYITDADDVTVSYTVPSEAAGCTVKVFAWDGIASLASFGDAIEFTVAG